MSMMRRRRSYDRYDPENQARAKRERAWWAFRRKLGLQSVEQVAKLLGLSTRSISRYEQAAEPPAWYQAALLGLIETFPDRDVARRAKPKKVQLDAYGYETGNPPANPFNASRWTKSGEPL